jgi:hypothetical protein
MLSFRKFITEGIRVGLPRITSMDHEQFTNLVKGGKVHIEGATEKTDGSTFQFGHDEHGFYSQSSGSGSERMRNPHDYAERATRRSQETGKPLDLTAANAFAAAHHALQTNQALQQHLKQRATESGGHTSVRGELFSKALSRPSEVPGEIKFVGTSYDPSHMGTVGKIVIHSRLPENQGHNIDHFKKRLSTSEMNFDDDKITHPAAHIDVSKETEGLKGINHELLSSRTTPKNKEAKMAEQGKLDTIKKTVSDKVDSAVRSMNIRPKWGSGTEGMVIHPSESNPDATRFKLTSDEFDQYKASEESKNFKNRGPK